MTIHVIPAGPIQTNAFLLTDAPRGEAVLIDAPGDVWPRVREVLAKENCRLAELWITHGHWDHVQGVNEVVKATGAKVRAHAADQHMMANPSIVEARMGFSLGLQAVYPDAWVNQGDRLSALGETVEVRHVPGHCPGNVLFYFASEKAAFVGDAIFSGSVGRTDLPGGSFEELERSIRTQIYTLPDATTLYPGHGGTTTVGKEKRDNPYVSA
jgi:glyoxylase-like metal-dependent hydrolase (beta-lactamase superfamily II)